jgi:2-C-methyl-D-erythritol 2,4-cyclodiphosphate synthase
MTSQSVPITRVGIGYDVHRLERGRRLVLGGVELPGDWGPVGHSDADVLAHAICDALLGAAGLGDIGTHFPDSDSRWKAISSLVFLEHTAVMLADRGLRIAWIDAVVVAERPKLGPHFPPMRQALAKALGILPSQINLKAKTNEGLGELGRGEAIAAQAVAALGGTQSGQNAGVSE